MPRRQNIIKSNYPSIPKRWPWGSTEWLACEAQNSALSLFESFRWAYDHGEWRDASYYQAQAALKYRLARELMNIEPKK